MTSALDRSGYVLGSGMVSDNGRQFLLTIPKNASTFLAEWAQANHWRFAVLNQCQEVREIIVVLRDPVSRWISGISQYINSYLLSPCGPDSPVYPSEDIKYDQASSVQEFLNYYNIVVERLFFDVIDRFDDHVYAQSGFVKPLKLPNQVTAFLIDSNLESNIITHLNWNQPGDLDRHISHEHTNLRMLHDFFQARLQERPELIARLCKHYADDQLLIDQLVLTAKESQ